MLNLFVSHIKKIHRLITLQNRDKLCICLGLFSAVDGHKWNAVMSIFCCRTETNLVFSWDLLTRRTKSTDVSRCSLVKRRSGLRRASSSSSSSDKLKNSDSRKKCLKPMGSRRVKSSGVPGSEGEQTMDSISQSGVGVGACCPIRRGAVRWGCVAAWWRCRWASVGLCPSSWTERRRCSSCSSPSSWRQRRRKKRGWGGKEEEEEERMRREGNNRVF